MGQQRKHATRTKRTPWLRAVGDRFRQLREAMDVGQDELPSPRPKVSKFENGDGVHLALLETWCRAAGIDPAAPFTETAAGVKESVQTDTESKAKALPPDELGLKSYSDADEVLTRLRKGAILMDQLGPITIEEAILILQRRQQQLGGQPEKKVEPKARRDLLRSRKK